MSHLSRRAAISCVLTACLIPALPAVSFSQTVDATSEAEIELTTHQYATKNGQDLYLDVIVDQSVEATEPRPVILYSFGGGWEGGNRGDASNASMWAPFLSEGYAVVAIDYRLGIREAKAAGEFTQENGTEMYLRAIEWGVEDLFDATTLVVDHADEWNLNAAQIVMLGGSSGATNSLVAEYNVANATPLATEHLPDGFRYAGVISMAGAFWLPKGTGLSFASTPAPIMFFHGAKDWLVTYDEVQADFSGYGPAYYFREFAGPDYPKWFVDYPEGDHLIAGLPITNRQSEMLAFMERLALGGEALSIHTVEESAVAPSFEALMRQAAEAERQPK